ncbi:RNA polymerase subunit sigma-70 [Tessaracoccus rhinocerotis]|uniref:RNA polymerase subunit sigma-70 n=1 Tax=Tessaracoccus rhinocerotis TaxID=1689449 RepID=A0A553K1N2_9ACTN|nr:SatD family protein [Tessaracoccus rhinocerotis]TRY18611.1 RNA polymerase subunit sigma-70 [Tessaracoccus rhinocerotis]
MAKMKEYANCVALLADLVGSRLGDRTRSHAAVLDAIEVTNAAVPALDPLRVTVGDELQGIYGSLGEAFRAGWSLRAALLDVADLRFGLGGGEVRVVDAERGIQDGSAWYLAREAIAWVEGLSDDPGYRSVRTAVRDERPMATPAADALVRLVEAAAAGLRPGTRRSLQGLLDGLDNATVAQREGISPSANSQRVNSNGLRVLADAVAALGELP